METVFEVGDEILIGNHSDHKGKKGITVAEVTNTGGLKIKLPNGTVISHAYSINTHEITLVKKVEKFELGDVIQNKSATNNVEYKYTITRIDLSKNIVYYDNTETKYDTYSDLHRTYRIVSKAKDLEIIGYELLKDLPGIPKGTNSVKSGNNWNFHGPSGIGNTFVYNQVSDTTWFKPIYKPKEVIVEISGNRKVEVTKDLAIISGVGSITRADIQYLNDVVLKVREVKGNTYTVLIPVVKVGCQDFTREDIQAVYKAVQGLNK